MLNENYNFMRKHTISEIINTIVRGIYIGGAIIFWLACFLISYSELGLLATFIGFLFFGLGVFLTVVGRYP